MTAGRVGSRRTTRAQADEPGARAALDLPYPAADAPALRRDAARNLAKILAAARTTFYEEGVDAGVETVAQRAGVGVGTLYRRFPTKESLIDAVVDELLQGVLATATDALANATPATGFAEFMRAVSQLQADHAGCLGRLWNDARHGPVRAEIEKACRKLLARAQKAGSVRADLVYEDVVLLHWSVRGVIETTAPVAPDAWLRHLDLLLAAAAPSAAPLGHRPLSAGQVDAVITLRGRLAGETAPG
ncbi:MAG TPA: helix-turn-helix domain-containing protein [Acidimicrobiales bacterium]|jgi:AcrR family transcriptional regulator|nr:helix-turn-helix domain-containing protein [Acidimicrobiales bacterium]